MERDALARHSRFGTSQDLHTQQTPHPERDEHRRPPVGPRRMDGVENSTGHRSDDRRPGPGRGVERDGPRERPVGSDHGRQRPSGRRGEGTRHPEQCGQQEEWPDRGRFGERVQRESDGAAHFTEGRDRSDDASIETVGDRSGDENQQSRREELGQTEKADVEFTSGDVVDLLAQRRRLQQDSSIDGDAVAEQVADGCERDEGSGAGCGVGRGFRQGAGGRHFPSQYPDLLSREP